MPADSMGSPLTKGGAHPAKTSATLIEATYLNIKDRIIRGGYGPGEKLRIEQLKNDFSVSGSTLREALTMLVADRLVVAEGQRGFKVMPVSRRDLVDLSQTRILLETEAVRQAIEVGNEQWEGNVASAFHILNRAAKKYGGQNDPEAFEEWEDRHRAFHLSLFSAAHSEWLHHFLTILYRQQHRYRSMFQTVTQKHPERTAHGEHKAIFEAAMMRDADRATSLLKEHLTRTIQEWVQHFDESGALSSAGNGERPTARARKHR